MKRLFSVALGLGLAAVFLMCIALVDTPACASDLQQIAQMANAQVPAIDTGAIDAPLASYYYVLKDFNAATNVGINYSYAASDNDIDQPSATETEVTFVAAFDYAVMGSGDMMKKDLAQTAAIATPAREPDHPAMAARAAVAKKA